MAITLPLLFIQFLIAWAPIILKEKDPITGKRKELIVSDYIVTFCLVLSFGFSIYMTIKNDELEEAKNNFNLELKQQLASRDSLHNIADSLLTRSFEKKLSSNDSVHKFDDSVLSKSYEKQLNNSYTNSIKASNIALAKYNLEMVDSMKKVTIINNTRNLNLPFLKIDAISPLGLPPIYINKKDSFPYINFRFVSINNISYNISVHVYLVSCRKFDVDKRYVLFDYKLLLEDGLLNGYTLVNQNNVTNTSSMRVGENIMDVEFGIILLQETFSSDMEGKNIINSSEMWQYNFKTGAIINRIVGENKNKIIRDLIRSKIIKG